MSIANEIHALQNLTVAELCARYIEVFGRKPRRRHTAYLRKRIAFQLQVAAYGGLPGPARAELERLAAELRLPGSGPQPATVNDDARGPTGRPKPGTTLVREWRGQRFTVEVTQDSFVWNGNRYGSLSAVAGAITGQHMNGRRFFGVDGRTTK